VSVAKKRPLVAEAGKCETLRPMITVIIPTLNAQMTLSNCLGALIPATLEGLVRQVVISDGGSTDLTARIVEDSGADFVKTPPGRGQQIRAGIALAKSPWLLVLHADTVLEPGWAEEAALFISDVDHGLRNPSAAAFRLSLNDRGLMPRLVESAANLRSTLGKLPYGDQALLIPRRLHDEIGGFKPLPLMEDLEIVRRLGRRRITILRSRAITSPKRYRKQGYLKRVARNQACLLMYAAGVPVERIAAFYDGPKNQLNRLNAAEHEEAAARNINPS
jgi:rSAM/selenodomain-associated transferase 2